MRTREVGSQVSSPVGVLIWRVAAEEKVARERTAAATATDFILKEGEWF